MNTKTCLIILFFLSISNISIGQTEKDSSREKSIDHNCIDQYSGLEIFKVVATPPLITSHDYERLESSIEQTVKKLRLNKKHKSILTLEMIFPIEGKPCISDIELNGDYLKDEKVRELTFELESINEFECGRQAKHKVICQSIFDIIIKKGQLHDIQYDNVEFK